MNTTGDTFGIGDLVFLRGCRHGVPGRVLRVERGSLVILWADLGPTYIWRHRPASLLKTVAPIPEVGRP
jgi:hypothetical protein